MPRKTNPAIIGGFVVGATLLAIAGVLTFGGGQLLKPKVKAVMFFQGSLAGLDAGAPVTFRGVKVGSVTDIVIEYDIAKQELHIPVYIEIEPDKLQVTSGERNPAKDMNALIARGLRGQLQTVSLVTGQTSINFDFHPDTPIQLLGFKRGIQEIPSIPSGIDVMMASVSGVLAKINSLPLEQMSMQLLDALKSAKQLLKDADTALSGVGGLIANVNAQVEPLSDSFMATTEQANLTLEEARKRLALREGEPMENLNETLVDVRRMVNILNGNLPQIIAGAEQVMNTATRALDQATATLQTAQHAISPDSALYYELDSTLRELKTAATAIRVFAEYIQRNPSALMTGNH